MHILKFYVYRFVEKKIAPGNGGGSGGGGGSAPLPPLALRNRYCCHCLYIRKEQKKKNVDSRDTMPLGFTTLLCTWTDVEECTKFLRMPPYLFDEFLQHIETDIQKEDTFMREPIPPKVKLAAP